MTGTTHGPCVQRVLQALHAARVPGWMFPAHFLDIFFASQVSSEGASAQMQIGPHCLNGSGTVSKAAVALLADVTMAAAVRGYAGRSVRIATMSMRLSFAALPAQGELKASASVRMMSVNLALPTAAVAVEISDAQGQLCCSGEATFAVLENRSGVAAHPLPTRSTLTGSLSPEALTEDERQIWERALSCEAASADGRSFLEQFWSLLPAADEHVRTACGVSWPVAVSGYNSNRVGHLQGGVLMGLMSSACASAAPQGMELVDISVQYQAPVQADVVQLKASPARIGRNAAFVNADMESADGRILASAQGNLVQKR
ncbi:PaaI family thioesterase [Comamonas sp. NoAH]|uniref:PaaI family thioesterase n=1 Tax=Comamonas halotolerans TaxID=3041496 RepID=UPI0024E14825|nr:PaaI family thioesterase [Comamonas sp. NoAH]